MAEGDKVALRVISTGTHKGEFLGIPPTDKKVSFVGVGFLTIRDGKIVEQWSVNDTMGLMQQIERYLQMHMLVVVVIVLLLLALDVLMDHQCSK